MLDFKWALLYRGIRLNIEKKHVYNTHNYAFFRDIFFFLLSQYQHTYLHTFDAGSRLLLSMLVIWIHLINDDV